MMYLYNLSYIEECAPTQQHMSVSSGVPDNPKETPGDQLSTVASIITPLMDNVLPMCLWYNSFTEIENKLSQLAV